MEEHKPLTGQLTTVGEGPVQVMQERMANPIPEPPPMTEEQIEANAIAAMQLSIASQKAIDDEVVASRQDFQEESFFWDAVTSNEFWLQDIPRNAKTAALNIASNSMGLQGDLESFIPAAFKLPIPGGQGMAPTSEDVASKIGGDPNHPSWLPSALLAPGPGEFATGAKVLKGMMVGGVLAKRSPAMLKSLKEFEAMDVGPFDRAGWQQTGWYKGDDGVPRFMLSDAEASVRKEHFSKHPEMKKHRKLAMETGEEVHGRVVSRLDEVFDHPELYKLYPKLRGIKIINHYKISPEGAPFFLDDAAPRGLQGETRMKGNKILEHIRTNNLPGGIDELTNVILHEVQHAVQLIEGFAGGGNASDAVQLLNEFKTGRILTTAMKKIDGGVDTVDDLFWEMVGEGVSQREAQELIESSFINQYLAADDVGRTDVRTAATAVQDQVTNDSLYVMDYLGLDETSDLSAFLEQADQSLDLEDIRNLSYNAYVHMYGEAEARLTPILRKKTQEQISKMKDPPSAHLADKLEEGRGLSSRGATAVPGTAQIKEKTGFSTAERLDIQVSPEENELLNFLEGLGIPIKDVDITDMQSVKKAVNELPSETVKEMIKEMVNSGDQFGSLSAKDLFKMADELGIDL